VTTTLSEYPVDAKLMKKLRPFVHLDDEEKTLFLKKSLTSADDDALQGFFPPSYCLLATTERVIAIAIDKRSNCVKTEIPVGNIASVGLQKGFLATKFNVASITGESHSLEFGKDIELQVLEWLRDTIRTLMPEQENQSNGLSSAESEGASVLVEFGTDGDLLRFIEPLPSDVEDLLAKNVDPKDTVLVKMRRAGSRKSDNLVVTDREVWLVKKGILGGQDTDEGLLGLVLARGRVSGRNYPFSVITGVEYQPTKGITSGHIQLFTPSTAEKDLETVFHYDADIISLPDGSTVNREEIAELVSRLIRRLVRDASESSPEADSPSGSSEILEQIESLHDLKGKGILTEEEFECKKQELLTRL